MARLTDSERQTLEACLRNLRALDGCQADFFPSDRSEEQGRLQLQGPWGRLSYRTFTRLRLTETSAEVAIHHLRNEPDGEKPLLLTDYLPEKVAAKLRRSGIDFVDAAGNASLRQPPLFVEVSGRKRPERQPRTGRAFQHAGLKLIFLLLRQPKAAAWTYRDLAGESGIALGAVGPVLKNLEQLGHLVERNGIRQLHAADELFRRWEIGYGDRLRATLGIQPCRPVAADGIARLPDMIREQGLEDDVLIGGELGACLLLREGTPEQASLHLAGDPLRLMLKLQLIPDPAGRVHLLRRFGRVDAWRGWQPQETPLADPLLLHAEMAATATRQPQIAERLFREYLAPRFAGRPVE
ncbi:hypothetical protein EDC39_11046 [Geothermobacter ehrlichii]|uniref:Transcriptional regulator with AbiEi antitoxin domain of type IV toxin-antitoxin system n=1 Tax=Geothermobacter ehrlichii TaxID=213224 RepID=A0A5D3WI20_9BACT|nr:type IV toxin-antitoxin system AbiEi family antitoxin [Geothermobacter ehrlichii]TYO97506.1 hypothetical protein EDC39_11046 [Geothermobacter ehrlichii]